jgi:hypothetical protein
VDQLRISGCSPIGGQDGQERSTPLSRLLAPAIRYMLRTVVIQPFCFESKRPGQLIGYKGFDSKQNVESDDVYERFDSKQKAAPIYRRSFSQKVMDVQARSWPFCAQRIGEMLMLS